MLGLVLNKITTNHTQLYLFDSYAQIWHNCTYTLLPMLNIINRFPPPSTIAHQWTYMSAYLFKTAKPVCETKQTMDSEARSLTSNVIMYQQLHFSIRTQKRHSIDVCCKNKFNQIKRRHRHKSDNINKHVMFCASLFVPLPPQTALILLALLEPGSFAVKPFSVMIYWLPNWTEPAGWLNCFTTGITLKKKKKNVVLHFKGTAL